MKIVSMNMNVNCEYEYQGHWGPASKLRGGFHPSKTFAWPYIIVLNVVVVPHFIRKLQP